jgi:ferrochelatase
MKVGVVLFNLGGPDRLESVEPFLRNLFADPAIVALPAPIRLPLARLLARRRAPAARAIYERIGGRSPLLDLTREQAAALERRLGGGARVFVCMRHWHPFAEETAAEVRAFAPDSIVLLPLYPQFSTTTSASAFAAWRRAAAGEGLSRPSRAVCCYPTEAGWIEAVAELVGRGLAEARAKLAAAGRPPGSARVLFSAHGLPERIVARGDPYPWQVRRTAEAVAAALGEAAPDWVVCYQSRVGPLKWIGPSTEAEIALAAFDGVGVVVAPIAFVSEHSETLVELDMDYRDLARRLGVPCYVRVAAVGTHSRFIDGLAALVGRALAGDAGMAAGEGPCPADRRGCPLLSVDRGQP